MSANHHQNPLKRKEKSSERIIWRPFDMWYESFPRLSFDFCLLSQLSASAMTCSYNDVSIWSSSCLSYRPLGCMSSFQGLSLPESRPLSHWETNPCSSLPYVSFLSCSSGFLMWFVSVLVGNWNHIPVPWSGGNKPLALLAEYWKYCSPVTSSSAWSVQMSAAQLSKHTNTCSSPPSFLSSRSRPSEVCECCWAQGLT